ncbi:MAG: gliding motility-associated C-terminal domain-containing protein [Saprospiraceae bacterium]
MIKDINNHFILSAVIILFTLFGIFNLSEKKETIKNPISVLDHSVSNKIQNIYIESNSNTKKVNVNKISSIVKVEVIVEICDNGIDDDDDGLVDCFDDECCFTSMCYQYYYNACPEESCTDLPFNFDIQKETIFDGIKIKGTEFIIAGDLDNDGNIEVIANAANNNDDVLIIDIVSGGLDAVLPGNGINRFAMGEIISGNNSAELIVANTSGITCYTGDGTVLWANINVAVQNLTFISIADFDGDGNPELYTEGVIINGQTGDIIINIPYPLLGRLGTFNNSMAVNILPDSDCPNCDGLEYVVGPFIFAIDIPTGTFYEEVANSRFTNQTSTTVIDWDLDGLLDIVLQDDSTIEVWNPRTDAFIDMVITTNLFVGYTSFGNLDNDPEPEALYIRSNIMIALDNDLSVLWSMPIVDNSGATGITLFDFNLDGKNEIVYRDEGDLRIISGIDGSTIRLQSCKAGTGGEYPLVIDVDNDQQAEIITVCDEIGEANKGSLSMFSATNGNPWPATRPIWNQINFFNVHVNDDLSIPIQQQQQQLAIVKPHLNGFLNPLALSFNTANDLEIIDVTVDNSCAFISMTVCNIGNVVLDNDFLSITFYDDDPEIAGTNNLISLEASHQEIAPGDCVDIDIPYSAFDFPDEGYVVINDDGLLTPPFDLNLDFPTTFLQECLYFNNKIAYSIDCTDTEICDNLIDDDGDGLIDAFDPDCNCDDTGGFVDYVPNADFVDHSDCCNILDATTNCISNWQTIAGTPEYNHPDCHDISSVVPVFVNTFDDPFVIFGAVGLTSEALSTCLTEPLISGKKYKLKLEIGLPDPFLAATGSETEFAVYGISNISDCENLYSEIGSSSVDFCSTSAAATAQEIFVVESTDLPVFVFKDYHIEFTANQNINAIVIVGNCGKVSKGVFYNIKYVQISNYKSSNWEYSSPITVSDPCINPVELSVISSDTLNYQWYNDSIPITNGTNASILLDSELTDSEFHVYVYNDNGCILLGPAIFNKDSIQTYDSISICQGESYIFGSQTITLPGDYKETYTPIGGCDSIAHLNVVLDNLLFSVIDAQICEGEFFDFDDNMLTSEDTYTATFTTSAGCDSMVTLNLTIAENKFSNIQDQFCQGHTYLFNGETLDIGGTYLDTLFIFSGCDSIVTLELEMINTSTSNIVESICNGDTYLFDGNIIDQSGNYVAMYTNVGGCDSIVNLELTVSDYLLRNFENNICENESYIFGTMSLTTSGEYIDTIINGIGCDSIVTLQLIVNPNSIMDENTTICEGESYIFGTQELTATGYYTQVLQNINGCDSTVNLTLSVQNSELGDTTFITLVNGESYTFINQSYNEMGIFTDTLMTNAGCDSILFLSIDLVPSDNVYFPNIISPNSMTGNNLFKAFSQIDLLITQYRIYDRWGNLLHSKDNFNISDTQNYWNGKYKNKEIEIGVYVYFVEVLTQSGSLKKYSGDITVVR